MYCKNVLVEGRAEAQGPFQPPEEVVSAANANCSQRQAGQGPQGPPGEAVAGPWGREGLGGVLDLPGLVLCCGSRDPVAAPPWSPFLSAVLCAQGGGGQVSRGAPERFSR